MDRKRSWQYNRQHHRHPREVTISTYQVSLEVYEGPLDLLLRLIQREELDITKVSLAVVADQYLAYIAVLQEISAAHLADFLVVAAKLLVIKSRRLLPGPTTAMTRGTQTTWQMNWPTSC